MQKNDRFHKLKKKEKKEKIKVWIMFKPHAHLHTIKKHTQKTLKQQIKSVGGVWLTSSLCI